MKDLLDNGMHVARLNFSHAGDDYSYPKMLFETVRNTKGHHESLRSDTKMPNNLRAILVDTKVRKFDTDPLKLINQL